MTVTACHRAEMSKPLIVIIVPSQDNPFFKSEADAAAARAQALGYRVRASTATTKDEVIAVLKKSFDACDAAFATVTDANAVVR